MDIIWIIISIAVIISLIAIAFLTMKKKRTNEDNALLTLAGTFVALGIIFSYDRLLGYSFIGIGVLISIISAIRRKTRNK